MTPVYPIALLAGGLALGLLVHASSFAVLRRTLAGPGHALGRSLVRNVRAPISLIVPLAVLTLTVAAVPTPRPARPILGHGLGVLLVFAVAWLVVRLTYVLDDVILGHFQLEVADNLRARQIHTQIQVLRRVTVVVVSVVAVAVVMLSFGAVRAIGAGLLASAGIFGLIAGIAAKPIATNLMAGVQLAISQPIRVDDVVVVEGHWGRVEQIALTYVVVRVWDLRRLVLPIVYFIENPFENWTRSTADILGWVFIEVDYTAPVAAIREHLHEVLSASPRWDGKVWNLQVTNLGRETMQLRALMSARDSATSWELQCEVRERLVTFLQSDHPGALPHLRAVLGSPGGPEVPTPAGEAPQRRTEGRRGGRAT